MAALESVGPKANPQQLEAITSTEGPVLIIAGPGSGKTFTLVERVVFLIQKRKIEPEKLFVVTFTDKAARELTTRISNRVSEISLDINLHEMFLGTFHSVCLRILQDHQEFTRLKRNFTLLDQCDQQYFLYQSIKEFRAIPDAQLVMGSDQSGRWAQSEQLLKWLNKIREEALQSSMLESAPEPEVRALAHCFLKYEALLEENNCIDFSGFYEVTAEKDKIVRRSEAKSDEIKKSFHLDHYCFDSNPERSLFWDLLHEKRVKKVYFTGMLTHGQSDFFIQYIDPDSRTVRSYYPDFVFLREETDGSLKYVIVEVKRDDQINDAVVQAKKDFAGQIAVASGMEYQLIKATDAAAKGFRSLL